MPEKYFSGKTSGKRKISGKVSGKTSGKIVDFRKEQFRENSESYFGTA